MRRAVKGDVLKKIKTEEKVVKKISTQCNGNDVLEKNRKYQQDVNKKRNIQTKSTNDHTRPIQMIWTCG